MWTLALLGSAVAADQAPSQIGVGLVAQGIRPGLVVEAVLPFTEKTTKRGKLRTHALVPTVSGWVHPSHYIPLQAHVHYAMIQRGKLLQENSVGLGVTYALNARPTFRVKEGELKRVPLAGAAVFSPGFGVGIGVPGEKRDFLVRARFNQWFGWQHSLGLSWNLELVVRTKKGG